MDLIAIGIIGLGFSLLLAIAPLARRQRRREMGLDQPVSEWKPRENWTWPER